MYEEYSITGRALNYSNALLFYLAAELEFNAWKKKIEEKNELVIINVEIVTPTEENFNFSFFAVAEKKQVSVDIEYIIVL